MPANASLAHYESRYQEIERQRAGSFGGASKLWRLSRFYLRGTKRLNNEWENDAFDPIPTGEAFLDSKHVYAHDLNVLGDGSLFEWVCMARSGIGQRSLANYLLNPADREEILARQQAVRELREEHDLREKIVLLGPHAFSEAKWETFTEWLDSPPVSLPNRALHILLLIGTILLLTFLFISVNQRALHPVAAALLVFQAALGVSLREKVQKAVGGLGALSTETRMLREGLELLEGRVFQSAKLRGLVEQVQGAASEVRKLEKLLWICKEREKDWFWALSRGLMAGTHVSIEVERWRTAHGVQLRRWMEAWGEFEALNAVGCYAFENPDNVYPEIAESGACFEGKAVGHPLLPNDGCVRNDVSLNADKRGFYVISGSNMAGKSTLLRSIGLNAVLAMAGAPVRATSLRLTPLSIVASLSIVDSLASGTSKFRAEVDRIKQGIDLTSGSRPVLFLIDEIFSGTNSRDRRAAAEAVVRALIGKRAIGALSTHDLALTEIADEPALRGVNVHMGSRGQGDPMDFDYLLKPGVTQESNALAIARMAGVVT